LHAIIGGGVVTKVGSWVFTNTWERAATKDERTLLRNALLRIFEPGKGCDALLSTIVIVGIKMSSTIWALKVNWQSLVVEISTCWSVEEAVLHCANWSLFFHANTITLIWGLILVKPNTIEFDIILVELRKFVLPPYRGAYLAEIRESSLICTTLTLIDFITVSYRSLKENVLSSSLGISTIAFSHSKVWHNVRDKLQCIVLLQVLRDVSL